MKTLAIIFSMVAFIAFSGYGQSADIKGLLDKPETRTEIFNTILENHELMTEFMKNMKGNEHAMMMMEEDSKMIGHDGEMEMKEDHKMMEMMKKDPEMMQKMMSNMMEMCKQDSAMCCNMANMMTENPEMMHMKMPKMKMKEMMDNRGCMQMMRKKDGDKQEHKH
jgi:hypothetical protein